MSAALKLSNGGRTPSLAMVADTFTQTGTDYFLGTQVATTTTAALNKGTVTQPGIMLLKNLAASNYVELAGATFTIGNGVIRVNAGECCMFRWLGTTPFILANGGDVSVEYLIIEA
jgi:hypothetical protein